MKIIKVILLLTQGRGGQLNKESLPETFGLSICARLHPFHQKFHMEAHIPPKGDKRVQGFSEIALGREQVHITNEIFDSRVIIFASF